MTNFGRTKSVFLFDLPIQTRFASGPKSIGWVFSDLSTEMCILVFRIKTSTMHLHCTFTVQFPCSNKMHWPDRFAISNSINVVRSQSVQYFRSYESKRVFLCFHTNVWENPWPLPRRFLSHLMSENHRSIAIIH